MFGKRYVKKIPPNLLGLAGYRIVLPRGGEEIEVQYPQVSWSRAKQSYMQSTLQSRLDPFFLSHLWDKVLLFIAFTHTTWLRIEGVAGTRNKITSSLISILISTDVAGSRMEMIEERARLDRMFSKLIWMFSFFDALPCIFVSSSLPTLECKSSFSSTTASKCLRKKPRC